MKIIPILLKINRKMEPYFIPALIVCQTFMVLYMGVAGWIKYPPIMAVCLVMVPIMAGLIVWATAGRISRQSENQPTKRETKI